MKRLFLGIFSAALFLSPAAMAELRSANIPAMLNCSRALNLQPQATRIGNQTDVVVPARRQGRNGLYFFSQDGAYFIALPLSAQTGTPFVVSFSTTNLGTGKQRQVFLRGSNYGADRFAFVPQDGTPNRAQAIGVVAQITPDRLAYNALQSFIERGFARRSSQVYTAYNQLPPAGKKGGIPQLLAFQKTIGACTEGTGQYLYEKTRAAIKQISVAVNRQLHPNGSLHRIEPPQVRGYVQQGSPSGGSFSYGPRTGG